MLILLAALSLFAPQETLARAPRTLQAQPTVGQPNIVLIIADDFGVDKVGAYGEASAPPCTPNIDSLAGSGMLFRNAWAMPVCVPTRAALMTGRYGFRTEIGSVGGNSTLPLAETALPEVLSQYDSSFLGKWHLAGGSMHPNRTGFAHFAGILGGGVQDYENWTKTTNGMASAATTYTTVETANDAIAELDTLSPPFFLTLSFNAPHTPFHAPPAETCNPTPPAGCQQTYCGNVGPNANARRLAKAMTEAMDYQIGRFLDALAEVDPNAYVFFIGDNGSARQTIEEPFIRAHGKGSVYEGGVNVPLIVKGPGVATAECRALVSVVDLFATFAEIAGVPSDAEDSVSFLPTLMNPAASMRRSVYTESFTPNGPPPYETHDRAVRNQRYKLIRRIDQPDELYDMFYDVHEKENLLLAPTVQEQFAYQSLVAELEALGVD